MSCEHGTPWEDKAIRSKLGLISAWIFDWRETNREAAMAEGWESPDMDAALDEIEALIEQLRPVMLR